MPFKIKICGVTNSEDALMIAAAGADAIGLNFFEKSKRYVAPETAARIVKDLPRTVKRVGVFVNASSEWICQIARSVSLDFVQLHGDEPPGFLAALGDLQIVRAFRCKDDLQQVHEYLERCEKLPSAVLIDAYDSNEFGGTGKTLSWPALRESKRYIGHLPWILAGGLTPMNVAQAVHEARPDGVDTASGVEKTTPGRKASDLCNSFVAESKSAFEELS